MKMKIKIISKVILKVWTSLKKNIKNKLFIYITYSNSEVSLNLSAESYRHTGVKI